MHAHSLKLCCPLEATLTEAASTWKTLRKTNGATAQNAETAVIRQIDFKMNVGHILMSSSEKIFEPYETRKLTSASHKV